MKDERRTGRTNCPHIREILNQIFNINLRRKNKRNTRIDFQLKFNTGTHRLRFNTSSASKFRCINKLFIAKFLRTRIHSIYFKIKFQGTFRRVGNVVFYFLQLNRLNSMYRIRIDIFLNLFSLIKKVLEVLKPQFAYKKDRRIFNYKFHYNIVQFD